MKRKREEQIKQTEIKQFEKFLQSHPREPIKPAVKEEVKRQLGL